MERIFAALAWFGIAYTVAATVLAGRWRARAPGTLAALPAVTLLKPLHGPEPLLDAKLATFLRQDYEGPVEMVCGVADAADPAAAVARGLGAGVAVVADPRRHGSNAKVSNLINMAAHARGSVLVLSDDDMVVEPDYLRHVVGALTHPDVGAVSCLYAGRGDAGPWSRIAAAGISWQFLPGVVVGLATGLAEPCMGSTIALARETLAAVGGFARVADQLADDFYLGEAVRGLGLRIAIPPVVLTHGCSERTLGELVRHELRWNTTVRQVTPAGYASSALAHPLAWGLVAWAAGAGPATAAVALLARLVLAIRVDRLVGRRTAPLWTLPLRDALSFGLFVAAFFTRQVRWRGARLDLAAGGRVTARGPVA